MTELDAVTLNFNAQAMAGLNLLLALIMFGVALDIRIDDFRRLGRHPKALVAGLFGQLILLPALTFALIFWLRPPPSIALGLIVVAACPGGSVSNFFSRVARGNVALSVSLSVITSSSAFLLTPLSVAFWGSRLPETRALLTEVDVSLAEMLSVVALVLILPTIAGCWLASRRRQVADRIRAPLRYFSGIVFVAFVFVACAANWSLFLAFFKIVASLVVGHNLLVLLAGFVFASGLRLAAEDRRTISIEMGIQNTALGLALIFAFFDGLGGMALVAGAWGVWHLISGAVLANFWAARPLVRDETAAAAGASGAAD